VLRKHRKGIKNATSHSRIQGKAKKIGRSVRAIAKEFNVPRSTLQDRIGGKPARNQAHEQLMHLTKVEETELVNWITTLTQRGYAPRYCTVRELAEFI